MHPAILYQKLKSKKVRCQVCQRRCTISPGNLGFCRTRLNQNGQLYTVIYNVVSSLHVDPIEKKPVFHYRPGTQALSLGTFGCNFRCRFCQNWEISYADASKLKQELDRFKFTPEQVLKMSQQENCQGIAFTYNEPAIWLEYCLAVSKLAKFNQQLSIVWVTNGYASKEAIDKIAPYLDVYRVDLKSFENRFYQKLIGLPNAKGVFETTQYVHDHYPHIHLECITNIIPGWNDDVATLKKIAHWIKENLGKKTPWHVTRFFPAAQMPNTPPTPPETLIKTQKIGFDAGLHFVYLGNMITEKGENTSCPKCQTLNIRRSGYTTAIVALKEKNGRGFCSKCGEDLNLIL